MQLCISSFSRQHPSDPTTLPNNSNTPLVKPMCILEQRRVVTRLKQPLLSVKALANAKVDKTEEETQKAHDAAMKVVEEKQHVAHDRLQMRLKKRTTITTAKVMTSVVVPVETKEDDDKAMQTKKKELNFLKNEKEGKKETRNVSNPGEI